MPPQLGTALDIKAPVSSAVSIAALLARRRRLTPVSRSRRDPRQETRRGGSFPACTRMTTNPSGAYSIPSLDVRSRANPALQAGLVERVRIGGIGVPVDDLRVPPASGSHERRHVRRFAL